MLVQIAGLCFTDAGVRGITMHHNVSLVVLSYAIAAVGSYAALELLERWRNDAGSTKFWWQAASAATLGGSVWSMHFIAMLALRIGLPMTYAVMPTVLSLAIAIGVVGAGLQIVRIKTTGTNVCCAGILIGLGVAAMHYVGMSALRFAGSVVYRPTLWGLSVLVGVAAATIALWLSLRLKQQWQRAAASLVMGVAICGMHYTGMASSVFLANPLTSGSNGLARDQLAVAVALATFGLLLCAIFFVSTDRRMLVSAIRDAESLRRSNERLETANAELALRRQQMSAVLDNITQGVCFFDSDKRLSIWNRRYVELYKLPFEAIHVGLSLQEIIEHRARVGTVPDTPLADFLATRDQIAVSNQPSRSVVTLRTGQVVAINHQPMPGGGWVATHEDITEQQEADARLVFMARHDALTKLPNRILFHERLQHALDLTGRASQCAILCLDLDHFKLVNDTLGHPVGDGLLRAASERLQACIREVDTLARLGGDEFAIVQYGIDRPEDAALLANRIVKAFQEPFIVDGHQIVIGTSVGVAVGPHDGTSPEKLLKNGDIALYLAKAEGRGIVRFFEPDMDARIQSRRQLELDLRAAIARDEFELYYQPSVNLGANKITRFEALLRWRHPTRGLVSPSDFIPLAEETGMIVSIGDWVVRTACFEAENWPEDIGLAVNLSAVQFKRGNVVSSVQGALNASGLRPDRLELEITETVLLQDTSATLTALHQLRAMGVSVALDDFGTGYSSLSYLRSFPFDKIKIDQSFVRDLAEDTDSMSIIRAVTGLGHSLCMKTTAEGVETQEQLDRLRKEGCTDVQGYFFSQPKPASEVSLLIQRLHLGHSHETVKSAGR